MHRRLLWVIFPTLSLVAIALIWHILREPAKAALSSGREASSAPIAVIAGVAEAKDVPIYLIGLGAVQAFNTVTVKVRVDGQIDKIAFTEGQDVKTGDLLAQIDPRPFQAALVQAQAAKARDESLLANAQLDLQRFSTLAQRDFATKQSVDTQQALVAQYQAAIQGDQAAIDNAEVQLSYTTVTAPISGRTGVRLVDQGNIVHASDSSGLVVITQLQPISVIFTLPQDALDEVTSAMAKGPLKVLAFKRDDVTQLGEGTVALIDNQIDTGSGTIRLKATFANNDLRLWPGLFVNARLLIETRHNAVTVPSPVVQRGPHGTVAYVIKSDHTIELRPIKVGQIRDNVAVVEQGLSVGEQVVVDGQYKLTAGSRVEASPVKQSSASEPNS